MKTLIAVYLLGLLGGASMLAVGLKAEPRINEIGLGPFSTRVGFIEDDVPLYKLNVDPSLRPCYAAVSHMGGMAKGKTVSLVCPR